MKKIKMITILLLITMMSFSQTIINSKTKEIIDLSKTEINFIKVSHRINVDMPIRFDVGDNKIYFLCDSIGNKIRFNNSIPVITLMLKNNWNLVSETKEKRNIVSKEIEISNQSYIRK